MDIIYRANDGTEFIYKEDCEYYEKMLKYRDKKMPLLFDRDMNVIAYSDIEEYYDLLKDGKYVYCYIENDNQAELFDDFTNDFALYVSPCKVGFWYFDEDYDEVFDLIHQYSKLKKVYDTFKEAIENLHRG